MDTEPKIPEAALVVFRKELEAGNVERALGVWPGECLLGQSGEQYSVRLSHGLGYSKARGVGRTLLMAMRRAYEAYEAYRRQWSDPQPLRVTGKLADAAGITLGQLRSAHSPPEGLARAIGHVVAIEDKPGGRLVTLQLVPECAVQLRTGDRWDCVISNPPCVVLRNAMDVTVTYYEADRTLPWGVKRPTGVTFHANLVSLVASLAKASIYPADDELRAIANLATRSGATHA